MNVQLLRYTDVPMRKQTLGHTEEKVSALCLGCLQFGSRDDQQLSYSILDAYVEAGGSFLDTSNNYVFWREGFYGGESEKMLGQWMTERKNRDDIFLATKVGAKPTFKGGTFDDAEGLSATVIERAVEESLENLRTDRIDLYYAHIDDRKTPLEETLEAFDTLIRSGKVRYIACSNYKPWRVHEAHAISKHCDLERYCAIQQWDTYLKLNTGEYLGLQEFMSDELVDYARTKKDFSLITYGPLLWGSYTQASREIPMNFQSDFNYRRLAALYKVAAEIQATPNQVVLAWLMQQDPVRIPIMAVGSVKQLKENLGALELILSNEQMQFLDEAGKVSVPSK